MQDKQVYEYAVIRLVPKVERGEFLNVGVILLCKRKRFLAMKYHLDPKRLQAFSEEIDLEEIADYLKAWDLVSQGSPEGGEIAQMEVAERFRWLTAVKSTIIQCSSVHPGLCGHPEQILEDLFEKYVL